MKLIVNTSDCARTIRANGDRNKHLNGKKDFSSECSDVRLTEEGEKKNPRQVGPFGD